MFDCHGNGNNLTDNAHQYNNMKQNKVKTTESKDGLKLTIPNLEEPIIRVDENINATYLMRNDVQGSREDFTSETFPLTNNSQTGIDGQMLTRGLPDTDMLFSPASSSSQKNIVTPTLKIDFHEDTWQDMLPASYVNVDDLKETSTQQQMQYLSAFTPIRCSSETSKSDTESDSGSTIYNTLGINPHDRAASPAMSYLTTGEDDIDDLLSVQSGLSGNSNVSLPLNPSGYKHVTNLDDLDNLLSMANAEFVELDELMPTPLKNDFQDQQQFGFPPVISIQEVQEQNQEGMSSQSNEIIQVQETFNDSHNIALGFIPATLSSPSVTIKCDGQNDANSSSLLHPDSLADISHEDMRHGRISKRRTSHSSRVSSRSSNKSRTRSLSPDEKARSISQDSDRLLELANLHPPSPKDVTHDHSSSQPLSPLDDGETLQNLSGDTKKRLAQKNAASFSCELCGKRFTRPYNLKSHLRTHTNERPFVCSICGKAFARQHDKKRHEDLHTGKKRYICGGKLKSGSTWGCGKKFARSDALGRHFKTESGRKCIAPLYAEAAKERQKYNDMSV